MMRLRSLCKSDFKMLKSKNWLTNPENYLFLFGLLASQTVLADFIAVSEVEFFITWERLFVVITRQLQAADVLSMLPTMNDKSSFVKVPLV
jgi:hypothetical protein